VFKTTKVFETTTVFETSTVFETTTVFETSTVFETTTEKRQCLVIRRPTRHCRYMNLRWKPALPVNYESPPANRWNSAPPGIRIAQVCPQFGGHCG
jgi:hypothetical protein